MKTIGTRATMMATVDNPAANPVKPLHFRLSPCKVKDYVGGDDVFGTTIASCQWVYTHIRAKKPDNFRYVYQLRVCGDNRETFHKIFGKRHFCFSGNHYFSAWRLKFKYEGKTYFYFILTAKEKGTCYERNTIDGETPDYCVNGDIHPVDRAFADWLEIKLKKFQKIV